MVRETPEFHQVPSGLPRVLLSSYDRALTLQTIIADRFKRLSGYDLAIQPVEIDRHGNTPPPVYCTDKPDCPRWCKGLWPNQVGKLRDDSGSFWLTTVCGRYCAMIPFSDDGRHVRGLRIACAGDVAEELWVGNLEFVNLLARYMAETDAKTESPQPAQRKTPESTPRPATHPLVTKACALIERRMADCELTVAGVAEALNVNATYLSHVFATETGQRMNRYINQQRIERAQHLLASTDWSIKRIGFECGFANASWFGQRFRDHAKMTPGEYRQCATAV